MCLIGVKGGHVYRSSQVSHGEPSRGSICCSCGDTHPGYDPISFNEKPREPRCVNKRCGRLVHDDGICLTIAQLLSIGCDGSPPVEKPSQPKFLVLGYHSIYERHSFGSCDQYYLANEVDAYLAPFALTDHPDKCAQAIRDHNDSAVRLHNEATIRASKLAAENVELQRRMVLLTRRLTDLSARIKRTKRMISRFKIF